MKRYAVVILVLGISLVLSLPFAAYAQEKVNYIVGKAGIYSPTGDLDDLEFDTGFNGQIAIGHYFHKNFALEGGLGYAVTDSSFGGLEWDAWTIPITLTAKGVYPIADTVELYAGAGIGIYFVQFEVSNRDYDDTVFGGHVVLGSNVNVTDNIFLGLEGTYIFTDEVELESVIFGVPLAVQADINGFVVTGNIGYRF